MSQLFSVQDTPQAPQPNFLGEGGAVRWVTMGYYRLL